MSERLRATSAALNAAWRLQIRDKVLESDAIEPSAEGDFGYLHEQHVNTTNE